MRKAVVYVHGTREGELMEENSGRYLFIYDDNYSSEPVSLTMPSSHKKIFISGFPAVF